MTYSIKSPNISNDNNVVNLECVRPLLDKIRNTPRMNEFLRLIESPAASKFLIANTGDLSETEKQQLLKECDDKIREIADKFTSEP